MITIEIYWEDLTENARERIRQALNLEKGDDNNWNYFPMATLEIEELEIKEDA